MPSWGEIARKTWHDKWVKESRKLLAKEINIPEQEKTHVFWWSGLGMHGKMKLINGEWYWCPPHIGHFGMKI